jgi:hypothetical protein
MTLALHIVGKDFLQRRWQLATWLIVGFLRKKPAVIQVRAMAEEAVP